MKAAVYCRVSTEDQGKEGTSLQTQLEACLKYCGEKGYAVGSQLSETFSGLTLDRPRLKELRELVKSGAIDVVVVYCLDRLSRDPVHVVIMTEEQETCGVRLEAVTETVESNDLGKFISYVRGFASKLEAEKIKERTMRGKVAHLKAGKLPQGTGVGIYGYRWDKAMGRRVIVEDEAKVVRQIFAMVIGGTSIHHIAKTLNQSDSKSKTGCSWHPLTVRRIAQNSAYAGKTYFGRTKRVSKSKVEAQPEANWYSLPKVTPPIVTEEIFDRAQEAMKQSKGLCPRKPNASYLLTGFAKCSKCGSPIGGTTLSGKYRYYQCRGARPTAARARFCDSGYIRADEIEQFVWERVVNVLSNPLATLKTWGADVPTEPRVADMVPLLDKQIAQLRKKLASYPAREKNLYDLLGEEAVTKDYVLDALNKAKCNRQEDEALLRGVLESRNEMGQDEHWELRIVSKLSDFCGTMRKNWSECSSLEERREALERLRVKVDAAPGKYNFTCFLDAEVSSDDVARLESLSSKERVEEFEAKHPDMVFQDLVDWKQIPEDTAFGQIANRLKTKDLVTIARTSALQRRHMSRRRRGG